MGPQGDDVHQVSVPGNNCLLSGLLAHLYLIDATNLVSVFALAAGKLRGNFAAHF